MSISGENRLESSMSRIPNATAVERALAILECLDGSKRGLNISELSRRLKIPKSSTHVIVVTLERLGYLEHKPASLNYHLGLKAYGMGHGMMKNLSVAEIALPNLRLLVDQLQMPAHLAVADGDQGVFIQKVDRPSLIRIDTYVGRRMDLHCTGVGKVILAWDTAVAEKILAKDAHMRYTSNTITSARALRRELVRVQKAGYAVDDEEEELGVRCVAVPVFNPAGQFAAALSVTGTTAQLPADAIESVAERLKRTAAGIFDRMAGEAHARGN
jgi:DNA-binding IclR family transcriptional regulator